jgi:hypothetical protein
MNAGFTLPIPGEPKEEPGMACVPEHRLSINQVELVLRQPNGRYALLELVRMGRVDSETATEVLDRVEKEPFWKRVALALVDAFFSR